MILIQNAILHIFDFRSGLTVFSEQPLDLGDNTVYSYLSKHIEKCVRDDAAKSGTGGADTELLNAVRSFAAGDMDFLQLSLRIGNAVSAFLAQSENLDSTDLLVCDFVGEERRWLAILLCKNKMGFTHHVIRDGASVRNVIINHHAILPAPSRKLEEYALLDLETMELRFLDRKRMVNGETSCLFQTLFDCQGGASAKEILRSVSDIALEVAESHGANTAVTVSKVKSYISETSGMESAPDADELMIDTEKLVREVFPSADMRQAFAEGVKKAGIPPVVQVKRSAPSVKAARVHKIKTDTGIEISIPADYFHNSDFVEFINQPDGSLSIELRKIGKIINK